MRRSAVVWAAVRRTLEYRRAAFGSFFQSEALPGALPLKQNSPQSPPYGLRPELISGTSFTAPRVHNQYSWTYRIRPSVNHSPPKYNELAHPTFVNEHGKYTPEQYRFRPVDTAASSLADFIDGITMIAVNGSGEEGDGAAAGVYAFGASMGARRRVFRNADADMVIMPQAGTLRVRTEFGDLDVEPQEFVLVPRGILLAVDAVDEAQGTCEGYVLENFGAQFVVPDLGPIGISGGLAHPRHFLAPEARFDDSPNCEAHELVAKLHGKLYTGDIQHSPFDVVAWYGNLVPLKYDMRLFMAINSVTYDHPDPSIGAVMCSYTNSPGTANIDFVIFAPRWMSAENTFRPPWYHRNWMCEFMGLIRGSYDAKDGFVKGATSIHNRHTPHGPDAVALEKGSSLDTSKPQRYTSDLAFMWESNKVWKPTQFALDHLKIHNYTQCWDSIPKAFDPSRVPGPERYPFSPDGFEQA